MGLDVIFKSLASTIRPPDNTITPLSLASVSESDHTESQIFTAQTFLEAVYGDPGADRGRNSRAQTPMSSSRAQTPMTVRTPSPGSPLQRTPTRPHTSPGSRLNLFRGPIYPSAAAICPLFSPRAANARYWSPGRPPTSTQTRMSCSYSIIHPTPL